MKTTYIKKGILVFLIIHFISEGYKIYGQGTWTQKADFAGSGRHSACGFSIGSKGYIGTGRNNANNFFGDFWEYNPLLNVWTQKANFGGSPREGAIGFAIGSKGYMGTGRSNANLYLYDFWEYDPLLNIWTQKANFGGFGGRRHASGFAIGSKGYVGTGGSSSYYNDFWEYDPSSNSWLQKTSFPGISREGAVGFSIGSKGYIGTGGYSIYPVANYYFNDFWEFDPLTNVWTQKANFPGISRCLATGFSIGAKGYIGTGWNQSNSYNDFWEYDPASNSWTQEAYVGGVPRRNAIGFSIGTKGFIGTGGLFDLQDFWEFTPNPTSVYEINSDISLQIYPVPFSEKLNFAINNKELSEIIIYDISSKKHLRQKFTNFVTLNTVQLPKGIYIYEISNKYGIIKKGKVVKD